MKKYTWQIAAGIGLIAAFSAAAFYFHGTSPRPTGAPPIGLIETNDMKRGEPSGPAYGGHTPYVYKTKDDYYITVQHDVTIRDGRTLRVTARAYCETYDESPLDAYTKACSDYVKRKLDYYAKDRDYFVSSLPVGNPAVRENALFPEDMMRRTLELTGFRDNLFTVVDIQPVKPTPA